MAGIFWRLSCSHFVDIFSRTPMGSIRILAQGFFIRVSSFLYHGGFIPKVSVLRRTGRSYIPFMTQPQKPCSIPLSMVTGLSIFKDRKYRFQHLLMKHWHILLWSPLENTIFYIPKYQIPNGEDRQNYPTLEKSQSETKSSGFTL
jgi:hypothetical protein